MHVLITGANRGVGAALARAYRGRGDEVTGTARDGSAEITLNVADPASVRAMAQGVADRPIDLLICNAGVLMDRDNRLETGYAPQLWAQTFAVNVTGVFLTVQALLPNLRAARGAKVAIISSQMGSSQKASGSSLIYRASKAAATNLACNLSALLADEGIAVGSYHPGWVQTDMGGSSADITPEQSAAGLIARFDALGPDTTGCFETWDGRAHPF
jgi:NAD(P)-dependent dehydrogenase (short-subunit alcohol dehydrogenase family)